MVKMSMKMAAVSTITLLLLCCSFITSTVSQNNCDYSAAVGDNITLPLKHQLTNSQRIKWKHETNVIIDRKPGSEKLTPSKEGADIHPNGSLKLTKVKISDAGQYTPEVFDENGRNVGGSKTVSLCVLDRVTKPTVKFQCPDPKPSKSSPSKASSSKASSPKATPTKSVIFTCDVSQGKDLKIVWLKNDEVLKKEEAKTLTQNPEEVAKDSFKCNVSNSVSFMISEPVKHKCSDSVSNFFFGRIMGVQIWIIMVCGGGVVVLLILIVIVCCIMNRRKKRISLKDEEELRLDWTNTQQHHHHHHHHHPHQQQQQQQLHHKHHEHDQPPDHHHHQQQSAGHTGPRQHRSRQHREQRPRAPDPPGGHPQPSPRRPAQDPGPLNTDDEQPPPLPQPRKKNPKPRAM